MTSVPGLKRWLTATSSLCVAEEILPRLKAWYADAGSTGHGQP